MINVPSRQSPPPHAQMYPGMQHLAQDFDRLNLDSRRSPPLHRGGHEQYAPFDDPHGYGNHNLGLDGSVDPLPRYEGYILTKAKNPGRTETWEQITKKKLQVTQEELKARVAKDKKKGVSALASLTHPDMKGAKRLQVDQLIKAQNASDPRYEYKLASLKREEGRNGRGARVTMSMQIILKREPAPAVSRARPQDDDSEFVDISSRRDQNSFPGSLPDRFAYPVPPSPHAYPGQQPFDAHPPGLGGHQERPGIPIPPQHAGPEVGWDHQGIPIPPHHPGPSVGFAPPHGQSTPEQDRFMPPPNPPMPPLDHLMPPQDHFAPQPNRPARPEGDRPFPEPYRNEPGPPFNRQEEFIGDPRAEHGKPPPNKATNQKNNSNPGDQKGPKNAKDKKDTNERRASGVFEFEAPYSGKKDKKARPPSDVFESDISDYVSDASGFSRAGTNGTGDTEFSSRDSRKEKRYYGEPRRSSRDRRTSRGFHDNGFHRKDSQRSSRRSSRDLDNDAHGTCFRQWRRRSRPSSPTSSQSSGSHYLYDDFVYVPHSSSARDRDQRSHARARRGSDLSSDGQRPAFHSRTTSHDEFPFGYGASPTSPPARRRSFGRRFSSNHGYHHHPIDINYDEHDRLRARMEMSGFERRREAEFMDQGVRRERERLMQDSVNDEQLRYSHRLDPGMMGDGTRGRMRMAAGGGGRSGRFGDIPRSRRVDNELQGAFGYGI